MPTKTLEHGDLFRRPGPDEALDYLWGRLMDRDLSQEEALALLSAVHRDLSASKAADPRVYFAYSRFMESLSKELPVVHDYVVAKWIESHRTNRRTVTSSGGKAPTLQAGRGVQGGDGGTVDEAAETQPQTAPQGGEAAAAAFLGRAVAVTGDAGEWEEPGEVEEKNEPGEGDEPRGGAPEGGAGEDRTEEDDPKEETDEQEGGEPHDRETESEETVDEEEPAEAEVQTQMDEPEAEAAESEPEQEGAEPSGEQEGAEASDAGEDPGGEAESPGQAGGHAEGGEGGEWPVLEEPEAPEPTEESDAGGEEAAPME